jgi:hypothetical protein
VICWAFEAMRRRPDGNIQWMSVMYTGGLEQQATAWNSYRRTTYRRQLDK